MLRTDNPCGEVNERTFYLPSRFSGRRFLCETEWILNAVMSVCLLHTNLGGRDPRIGWWLHSSIMASTLEAALCRKVAAGVPTLASQFLEGGRWEGSRGLSSLLSWPPLESFLPHPATSSYKPYLRERQEQRFQPCPSPRKKGPADIEEATSNLCHSI